MYTTRAKMTFNETLTLGSAMAYQFMCYDQVAKYFKHSDYNNIFF